MTMDGERDRRETFGSTPLPDEPTPDAEPLAKGIEPMLEEGPDRVAVKIGRQAGRTLYVGINADGKPMTAGPVTTDAEYFTVDVDLDSRVDRWTVEATALSVNGKAVLSSSTGDLVDQNRNR